MSFFKVNDRGLSGGFGLECLYKRTELKFTVSAIFFTPKSVKEMEEISLIITSLSPKIGSLLGLVKIRHVLSLHSVFSWCTVQQWLSLNLRQYCSQFSFGYSGREYCLRTCHQLQYVQNMHNVYPTSLFIHFYVCSRFIISPQCWWCFHSHCGPFFDCKFVADVTLISG